MPSIAQSQSPKSKRIKPTGALTEREHHQIVILFMDGHRPAEISQELKRGYVTVANAIIKAGYKPERYSYTESDSILWAEMYLGVGQNDKHCVREIAEYAECSASRINSALLRRGVRIRHPALGVKISAEKRRLAKQ